MTADGVSVRVAEPRDSDRMRDVSTAARGVEGADQSGAIAGADALVLVAERDGAVVGWAKTHHFESASGPAPAGHYLGGVNVHPEFQRLGIGSALTSARLDWIRERASETWFFTNVRNSASIALHARLGFVEVARAREFQGVSFEGGAGILFRLAL